MIIESRKERQDDDGDRQIAGLVHEVIVDYPGQKDMRDFLAVHEKEDLQMNEIEQPLEEEPIEPMPSPKEEKLQPPR